MPYVTLGEGNSGSIDLYYEDRGLGPPAVLIAASSAAVACSATWETDFRADLRKIDGPVLVVQGDPVDLRRAGLHRAAAVQRRARRGARPLTGAPATTQDNRAMPPSTSTMSLPDAGTVRWPSK